MAVRKYRDVSQMPGPQILPALHPDNLKLACELSSLALSLARQRRAKSSVVKYRSYEEIGSTPADGQTPPSDAQRI